ncbi:MAG: diguanylate cyclase [Planctomycetota bacterium]
MHPEDAVDPFEAAVFDHRGGATGRLLLVRLEEEADRAGEGARVGGEEFMVLLLDMDDDRLAKAAERFRAVIESTPMPLAYGSQLTLTASIGGSVVTSEDSIRGLLGRLDNALYRAKNQGRNTVEID